MHSSQSLSKYLFLCHVKNTYDSSIKIKREQKRNSEKFKGVCMVIIWFYNRFSSQIWRLYNPDYKFWVSKCRLIGTSFSSGYIMTLAATQLLFFQSSDQLFVCRLCCCYQWCILPAACCNLPPPAAPPLACCLPACSNYKTCNVVPSITLAWRNFFPCQSPCWN